MAINACRCSTHNRSFKDGSFNFNYCLVIAKKKKKIVGLKTVASQHRGQFRDYMRQHSSRFLSCLWTRFLHCVQQHLNPTACGYSHLGSKSSRECYHLCITNSQPGLWRVHFEWKMTFACVSETQAWMSILFLYLNDRLLWRPLVRNDLEVWIKKIVFPLKQHG